MNGANTRSAGRRSVAPHQVAIVGGAGQDRGDPDVAATLSALLNASGWAFEPGLP